MFPDNIVELTSVGISNEAPDSNRIHSIDMFPHLEAAVSGV